MPNLKTRIVNTYDSILNRPPWHRQILENASGYRSTAAMQTDFDFAIQNQMYGQLQPNTQKDAAIIYGRAGRPKLGYLVIGRQQIPNAGLVRSTQNYPMIDEDVFANFGVLNESEGRRGSALFSRSWNFYKNDMFIMGGTANRVPFHLASKRTVTNLWEPFVERPSIFARELAGLFAEGYELQKHYGGREIMVSRPGQPTSGAIRTYHAALDVFLTKNNITQGMAHPEIWKFTYHPERKVVIPQFMK